MGLRQATALRVKAYVGGLYLEKRSSDPDTVINPRQRKRVTMVFLRDIDGARLRSGWADELRKVGGTEASIARFTSLIGDVKKGDTMSFTWCPDAGVEVAARGTVRGTVPGDGFARTLFTIWFGPDPGDANLKRGMLGKSRRAPSSGPDPLRLVAQESPTVRGPGSADKSGYVY
jgi:hypothetical protein